MVVCLDCRRAVAVGEEICETCGSTARADVDAKGYIVAFAGDAGIGCAACGTDAPELQLRRYRRVVGLAILDRVHTSAGYFCADCRGSQFRRHMALTLVFG